MCLVNTGTINKLTNLIEQPMLEKKNFCYKLSVFFTKIQEYQNITITVVSLVLFTLNFLLCNCLEALWSFVN